MDVKSAFLDGKISEEICVKQLERYEVLEKEYTLYKLKNYTI